jgi:hypothetical protein
VIAVSVCLYTIKKSTLIEMMNGVFASDVRVRIYFSRKRSGIISARRLPRMHIPESRKLPCKDRPYSGVKINVAWVRIGKGFNAIAEMTITKRVASSSKVRKYLW